MNLKFSPKVGQVGLYFRQNSSLRDVMNGSTEDDKHSKLTLWVTSWTRAEEKENLRKNPFDANTIKFLRY